VNVKATLSSIVEANVLITKFDERVHVPGDPAYFGCRSRLQSDLGYVLPTLIRRNIPGDHHDGLERWSPA